MHFDIINMKCKYLLVSLHPNIDVDCTGALEPRDKHLLICAATLEVTGCKIFGVCGARLFADKRANDVDCQVCYYYRVIN